MKTLLRRSVLMSVAALFVLAIPSVALARASIIQSPDTTGMIYEGGTALTISWECSEIPSTANIVLGIAEPSGGGVSIESIVQRLPLTGEYTVTLPATGGPYFYTVTASWTDATGNHAVDSNAYDAYYTGTPWWFWITPTPRVTQQPRNSVASDGTTTTFSATAVGPQELSVQWQVDDGSGWVDIEGATATSYTTPLVTQEMNGWYYRAVFTNDYGTTESNPALLTVLLPTSISQPSANPTALRPRRDATFQATVTPAAAVSGRIFTLHFLHYETRRVGGQRVADWYEYPSLTLSVSDASQGIISGVGSVPKRGEWKMYVTCPTGGGYSAATSSVATFTAR